MKKKKQDKNKKENGKRILSIYIFVFRYKGRQCKWIQQAVIVSQKKPNNLKIRRVKIRISGGYLLLFTISLVHILISSPHQIKTDKKMIQ